jgi:hypothetical protein
MDFCTLIAFRSEYHRYSSHYPLSLKCIHFARLTLQDFDSKKTIDRASQRKIRLIRVKGGIINAL